jgi:hypothetical protein
VYPPPYPTDRATQPQANYKKQLGGPKGGRLLEKTEPKAEFYVEKGSGV